MPADSSRLFQQNRARVVATIATASEWQTAKTLLPSDKNGPDILEIRADLLLGNDENLPGLPTDLPLPTLLTVRSTAEGGRGPVVAHRRSENYLRHLDQVDAIDLELATALEMSALIQEAKKAGVACVFSYHDFSGSPDAARLNEMRDMAISLGADLFKVAATTDSTTELYSLLHWLENDNHSIPLAVMGMGKLGKMSRLLLAQLGSQLNYGYIDAPVATGQWPASQLKGLITSL